MKRFLFTILSAFLIAHLIVWPICADTTFTDTGDHDWNNAANWSAGVPDADENITIASGSVALPSDISIPTSTFTLTAGTVNLNGHSLTQKILSSSNSNTRAIVDTVGGGKLILMGVTGTIFDTATSTGLTISNAPAIQIGDGTQTLTGNVTFAGAGKTYGDFTVKRHAGDYDAILTGSNTIGTLTLETPNASYPYSDLQLHYSTTQTVSGFSAVGTSSYPINFKTDSVGTAANMIDTSGTNTVSYLKIMDIVVYGGALWDASDGTNTNVNPATGGGWKFPTTNYYVNANGNDTTCSGKSSIAQPSTAAVSTVTRTTAGGYAGNKDCTCTGTGGTGSGISVHFTTDFGGAMKNDYTLYVAGGGTGYTIGDVITIPSANCTDTVGGKCGSPGFSGNGQVTVATFDCAKQTIAGINALNFNYDDVINIRNGATYTGPIKTNIRAIGAIFSGYNDPLSPSTALPVISGGSDGGRTISAYVQAHYQQFKKLKFTSPFRADLVKNFSLIHNVFEGVDATGSNGVIDFSGGTGATINANVFNNVFAYMPTAAYHIFSTGTSGIVNAKNNIFYGPGKLTAYMSSTVNASNNIFHGTQSWNQGQYPDHCLATVSGVCNESNNVYNYDPNFAVKKYPQTVKVAWGHDDPANLPHFFNVLEAYPALTKASFNYYLQFNLAQTADALCAATTHCINKSLTACTTGGPTYAGCCNACLKSDVDAGRVEIVNHTYHHQGLSDNVAFTLTTTNTNPSAVIDGTSATKKITLTSDAGTIEVDYTANDGTASAKTMSDLHNAMGCSDINCTTSTSGWRHTTPASTQEGLFLSSLKDTTCSSFPCSLNLDKGTATNRLYRDEIGIAKTGLESLFGAGSINSFSCPASAGVGNIDKTSWDWFEADGTYKGVRNSSGLGDITLDHVNYWNILSLPAYAFRGDNGALQGSETYVRSAARNAVAWAQTTGGYIITYTHGTSDLTVEQIGWIFDEFNKMGVEYVTTSTLFDWIRTTAPTVISSALCKADQSSNAPSAGQCHTGSFNTPDYHIMSGSYGIDAGTNLCATLINATDIDGNAVCTAGVYTGAGSAPDIGPYEYQLVNTGVPAGMFMGRKFKHMIQ